MRVLISTDGYFCISKEAAEYMADRGHEMARFRLQVHMIEYLADRLDDHSPVGGVYFPGEGNHIDRHDPLLLEAFDVLGKRMNADYCILKAVEIPDDVKYYVDMKTDFHSSGEIIIENHRRWS